MDQTIKIVFLDIDGTLVHKGELLESAITTVARLQQNQVQVALATGRSLLHTRQIQAQLGIHHAVYFNGGLAMSGEEVLQSSPLAPEVVTRIRRFSESNDLPMILHSEHRALVFDDIPSHFRPLLDEYQFPQLNKVTHAHWHAGLTDVYQANVFMRQTWDQVAQNEFPECLLYRWDDTAVDLQKRGCDKSVGALALLRHLRIPPSEALHIGDGGNDVGMFQSMGMSVAMGNAPSEVKQYAKKVTDSVEQDGVLHALERLNLI